MTRIKKDLEKIKKKKKRNRIQNCPLIKIFKDK